MGQVFYIGHWVLCLCFGFLFVHVLYNQPPIVEEIIFIIYTVLYFSCIFTLDILNLLNFKC